MSDTHRNDHHAARTAKQGLLWLLGAAALGLVWAMLRLAMGLWGGSQVPLPPPGPHAFAPEVNLFVLALMLLALLALGRWFARRPWGQVLRWNPSSARWDAVSPPLPLDPVPRHRLVEPHEARQGVGFWLAAAGLVFLIVLIAGAFSFEDVPLQVTGSLLVSGVVLVAATVNAMNTWTRQIDISDDGVLDRDFFNTRQVPWQAIDSMRLVDANQSAQDQFELSARHARTGTTGRMRPRAMKFWSLSAANGQELLGLPAQLQGSTGFEWLRQRVESGRAPTAAMSASTPAQPELGRGLGSGSWQVGRRLPLFSRQHLAVLLGTALMVTPFILGAVWSSASVLYYVWLAEEVQGTVVEKSEGALPSLVVSYRPPNGQTLVLQTNGEAGHAQTPVGASVRVYFDPQRPQDAKPDFWLELWLIPLCLNALALVVLAAATLIARSLTSPPRQWVPSAVDSGSSA